MLRILLVDDAPLVLIGLQGMLEWEKLGYTVCGTARNGKLALELIEREKPDIVIADVKMPVMDGLTLARTCRERNALPAFIMLTSFEEFDYIKQANGAEHLLTQLFFYNMHFYRFLNLARRAGVTLPVSAGVMPIVKRSQIERTVSLSSASLPSECTRMISRYQDDPASLYDAGIDYAVKQLRDLIEGGADGIHLYAMHDAAVAAKVYAGIRDLL